MLSKRRKCRNCGKLISLSELAVVERIGHMPPLYTHASPCVKQDASEDPIGDQQLKEASPMLTKDQIQALRDMSTQNAPISPTMMRIAVGEIDALTALLAEIVEISRKHEWSTRNTGENTFCPSCASTDDRWRDQFGHNPGCVFVDTVNRARTALGLPPLTDPFSGNPV